MKERKANKMTVGEEAAQISLEEKREVRRKKPQRGRGGGEEGAGRSENELPPPPPPILRPGARDKGKQQRWEMESRDLGQGVAGTSQGGRGMVCPTGRLPPALRFQISLPSLCYSNLGCKESLGRKCAG